MMEALDTKMPAINRTIAMIKLTYEAKRRIGEVVSPIEQLAFDAAYYLGLAISEVEKLEDKVDKLSLAVAHCRNK